MTVKLKQAEAGGYREREKGLLEIRTAGSLKFLDNYNNNGFGEEIFRKINSLHNIWERHILFFIITF